MQATDNGVISVRARIAAATWFALCACGCRQVDTLAPNSSSISVRRQSLPVVAGPSSAQVVEVCRIPTDESQGVQSTALDDLGAVNCNFTEFGCANGAPSGGDGEPLPPNIGDAAKGIAALADESAGTSSGQQSAQGETADRSFKSRCCEIYASTRDNVFRDFANYYTTSTLGEFIVILAPAAVFANSDWDADVGNWYQAHIRSASTDRAANYFRPLGEGTYLIPIYVSAKFVGEYFDDLPGMALLGEFGDRTSRALLVGGLPFLAVQGLTGGGRPQLYVDESYWRPFHSSHGASGHAFLGALPFLALAGMTDEPLAKCFFYACSPWTGFTRINDNVHYISQVWLGWWMAYLGTEAVYKTEKEKCPFVVTPMCTPEMTGVGVVFQH